tara:strand:- start:226 stop:762 length:537 start_codon:yes stop_codon:yes gene_type:complete
MPLCYGGGIKSLHDAQKIFSLGVEKISISSAIFSDSKLISNIAKSVGSQSVVVTLDIKKNIFGQYSVYTLNGKKKMKDNLFDLINIVQSEGAGEIVINNIDLDGTMSGYDLELLDKIKEKISVPLTMLGGAGKPEHFKDVLNIMPIIGMSAGSFFVFKGKYKAVLISYQKNKILDNYK